MRLVPHGGSIDPLASRKSGSPARPLVDHREGLVGDLGQDVGRRVEQPRRLLGQHEDAVARGPIEGEDEISRRERGVDDDAGLHAERERNRPSRRPGSRRGPGPRARAPSPPDRRACSGSEPGERRLASLNSPWRRLSPSCDEILDDDPVSLVRGCCSMSRSQHGDRRVILVALQAFQLAATDHLRSYAGPVPGPLERSSSDVKQRISRSIRKLATRIITWV